MDDVSAGSAFENRSGTEKEPPGQGHERGYRERNRQEYDRAIALHEEDDGQDEWDHGPIEEERADSLAGAA